MKVGQLVFYKGWQYFIVSLPWSRVQGLVKISATDSGQGAFTVHKDYLRVI